MDTVYLTDNVFSNSLTESFYFQIRNYSKSTPMDQNGLINDVKKDITDNSKNLMSKVDPVNPVEISKQTYTEEKIEQPVKIVEQFNYYPSPDLSEDVSYTMEIGQFVDLQNFHAQILDWFLHFDELYDEFQAECNESKQFLTRDKLGKIKTLCLHVLTNHLIEF